jgi:hypothetical protein
MERLRIVDARDKVELTWAELDGDRVTYAPTDRSGVAESVVTNHMRDRGVELPTAFAELQRDGWSNGYLMVDRSA